MKFLHCDLWLACSSLAAVTAVFLDSTLWLQRYGRRGARGSSSMAGGSKLNDYIDDSFKANSDDDDEIEEPKLLPHSLFTVAVGRAVSATVQ